LDGNLGLVGSVNFTPRSFSVNEESGVYFKDKYMVRDLDQILKDWRKEAHLVNEINGSSRRWYQRFLSWATAQFKNYV
jgi:phosphatidylserine/phosphatidylglycerophosphate/cardiolipin synthase-like enzyme